MKKLIIMLTALFTMTVSANAMSYEQARQQALFLTDKMAYELNLTEQQYEAAYEVNLDYLMSINTRDDLYGTYWTRRNLDLSYILFDWQYAAYCAATYFYRPLYWDAGYWHFGIYARYPYRDYFYFGRPHFWHTYRGGHAWHNNHGRSWYHGRTFGPHRPQGSHVGMRDHHSGGSFGNNGGGRGYDNRGNSSGRTFGNMRTNPGRGSSTRQTVTQEGTNGRSFGSGSSREGRSFGSGSSTSGRTFGSGSSSYSRPSGSYSGGSRSFGSSSSGSRSFGSGSSSYSRPSGSFSGGSRSFGGHSGGFSSGGGSRSFGGGGHSGGGSRGGGGGHFGGRR